MQKLLLIMMHEPEEYKPGNDCRAFLM